jgi:RNA polymerase sigma-70 factor (ECF subfamily)
MDTVVSILAEDVTLIADGGGKAFTAVHPIQSRDHVVQFLFGLMRKAEGMKMEITEINGQIGLVIHEGDRIDTVVIMHFEKGTIHNLYFVRNPDKLRHL